MDQGWRRRDFLSAGALASLRPLQAAKSSRKPNVIVILADDLGYGDLGVYGCQDIPTPHIDSLARNGVRFTDAYVSAPYCSPTRAGLMTGRYQERFGHEFNAHSTPHFLKLGGDPKKQGLPLSETTFADRMRAAGYATGAVGKWHLGSEDVRFHPLRRGFQEFFGFLEGGHAYFPNDPVHYAGLQIRRGYDPVPFEGYLTDVFGSEAVSFIGRHRAAPFFLYFAPNAVHTPMQAAPKFADKFEHITDKRRRTYAAMLASLDENVGRVLDKLRELDLEKDTLIFFLSDNGGPTNKFAPNGSRNGPLRGSKGDLWEGGIHVPFLMQWKGRLPAGVEYHKPVIQLDILPTALGAAGVKAKPEWKLDGVNLLEYLGRARKDAPHDVLYWRFGQLLALRSDSWKVVRTWDNTTPQLFNLSKDLGENHDLSKERPDLLKELLDSWRRWNSELVPPLWPMPEEDPAPVTSKI